MAFEDINNVMRQQQQAAASSAQPEKPVTGAAVAATFIGVNLQDAKGLSNFDTKGLIDPSRKMLSLSSKPDEQKANKFQALLAKAGHEARDINRNSSSGGGSGGGGGGGGAASGGGSAASGSSSSAPVSSGGGGGGGAASSGSSNSSRGGAGDISLASAISAASGINWDSNMIAPAPMPSFQMDHTPVAPAPVAIAPEAVAPSGPAMG